MNFFDGGKCEGKWFNCYLREQLPHSDLQVWVSEFCKKCRQPHACSPTEGEPWRLCTRRSFDTRAKNSLCRSASLVISGIVCSVISHLCTPQQEVRPVLPELYWRTLGDKIGSGQPCKAEQEACSRVCGSLTCPNHNQGNSRERTKR
jgi:hypothetical protein